MHPASVVGDYVASDAPMEGENMTWRMIKWVTFEVRVTIEGVERWIEGERAADTVVIDGASVVVVFGGMSETITPVRKVDVGAIGGLDAEQRIACRLARDGVKVWPMVGRKGRTHVGDGWTDLVEG